MHYHQGYHPRFWASTSLGVMKFLGSISTRVIPDMIYLKFKIDKKGKDRLKLPWQEKEHRGLERKVSRKILEGKSKVSSPSEARGYILMR